MKILFLLFVGLYEI